MRRCGDSLVWAVLRIEHTGPVGAIPDDALCLPPNTAICGRDRQVLLVIREQWLGEAQKHLEQPDIVK